MITSPEPRQGLTDYQPADRGSGNGSNPRLNALLREVDEVERTMHQLRAQLAASEDKPASNGNGHHAAGYRPGPRSRGDSNGNGNRNSRRPRGDSSRKQPTRNAKRQAAPTPAIARTSESDWPITPLQASGQGAPPATKTSWVGILGAAVLGLAGLIYLFAGPTGVAASIAGAHMTGFDVAAVALALLDAYLFSLAFTGREPSKRTAAPPRGKPFFVLAIPAREGAAAVASSVRHLLGLQYDAFVVVVVDCGDGSVAEAALDAAQADRRVMVERLPGSSRADALNHAFGIAGGLVDRQDPRLGGVSAAGTLLGLLEPGAWLEPDSLRAVARQFDRQHCAAAQVHVRILGARHSTTAAIEDLETAAFHVIAQTARNRSGTVQLTETGSFFRIGALRKLPPNPWSGSLDDEFDIALRLIELGHRIRSCRETCAYRPGASSLRTLARSRRRRARARRKAWPHISRLWETRRISIATRVTMTFDLLVATPLLAPAAVLASVLALGLAVLPNSQSAIAGLLQGGIGTRVVVLALFVLPLAALCVAYGGTSGARRRRVREVAEAEGISTWALPGVAFAFLASALLRLVPGPSKAPATNARVVYETPALPVATTATPPATERTPAAEDVPVRAPVAAPAPAPAPVSVAAPLRPAPLRAAPLRAVASYPSSAPSHGFDSRDAETIQNWVRSG